MKNELDDMAASGIGQVIFLEVDLGVPRGPVRFMSEVWQDNFTFVVNEAERLGIGVSLGAGPGWAGSGGPWINPAESMKHLVASQVRVVGPATVDVLLPVPEPRKPTAFSGMSDQLIRQRQDWYKDVMVLAFPTPDEEPTHELSEFDVKTLYETQPYSIWKQAPRFVPAPVTFPEVGNGSVVESENVIDLSGHLGADGRLHWNVPPGAWTIMRFGARNNSVTTRPAPQAGYGFENDKFDAATFEKHFANFQGRLLEKASAGSDGKGWSRIHLDSWEMSSQNWSDGFRDAFEASRGYDPTPFFPAYAGVIVESVEETERFLWDVRKAAQELVLENYAEKIREMAHANGFLYSNQPYDMNPAGDIDLGSVADIPSCEFWAVGYGPDTVYACLEAASIAHTMGRKIVQAEAFTTMPSGMVHSPRRMKNQTDWAFASDINALFFHTYVHQPLGDEIKPGITLGPHGVHWNRNQTWWSMVAPYHRYVSRLSLALRLGTAVADILYLTPEGAPHIFLPPPDAMQGEDVLRYKKGHRFDAVSPRILIERANVDNGRISFPGGTSYAVLVLPNQRTVTPRLAIKLEQLIKAGAVVIGNPPLKSPSLSDFPEADAKVSAISQRIWRSLEPPAALAKQHYGAGAIYWGRDLERSDDSDSLYPPYALTEQALQEIGLKPDLSADRALRFTHRTTPDREIYFVSNPTGETVTTDVRFRVGRATPELWNPLTGERQTADVVSVQEHATTISLAFAPYESFLVVFSKKAAAGDRVPPRCRENCDERTVAYINGPWTVTFDAQFGGPPNPVVFDRLTPWNEHSDGKIKYYSGVASYETTFDAPTDLRNATDVYLNLGEISDMARVLINGEELGVVFADPLRIKILVEKLKATGNVLQIHAANNWNNRLIGDAQPGNKDARELQFDNGLLMGKPRKAGRYTYTTLDWYKPDMPLQDSGLFGPVTINYTTRHP